MLTLSVPCVSYSATVSRRSSEQLPVLPKVWPWLSSGAGYPSARDLHGRQFPGRCHHQARSLTLKRSITRRLSAYPGLHIILHKPHVGGKLLQATTMSAGEAQSMGFTQELRVGI